MADSGSTKNLTYTKAKQYEPEMTVQLDADSLVPRETGGTPRFKNKIRMSKDKAEEIFNWPVSSEDEKPTVKRTKKKKSKSPPPKQRK